MNTTIINRNFSYLAFIVLGIILILSLSIPFSSFTTKYPELAVGITYDLTLTAPLLYFFLIRRTRIPNTTAIPFFVGAIIFASFIIPVENQNHLNFVIKWIVPVVELSAMLFIGLTVYRSVKTYKTIKNKDSDILQVLNETSEKVIGIPAIGRVFAFELAVIYYAFFSWRKFSPTDKTFTYHKKSGKLTLFGIIIFIIGIETIVLHILIVQWNVIVAWILTISSVYVILQMFAHLKAVYQRPIEFFDDKIVVRYGLFGGTEIDFENIEEITFSTQKPQELKDVKQVALLGELEHFNTIIQLKNETEFLGFYGLKDQYKTLLLFIDDTEKFNELMQKK